MTSGQEVEMDMEHRLSDPFAIVLHHAEAGIGIPHLADDFARLSENIADKGIVLPGHVEAIDKMPLWQKEQVQGRFGRDILDDEDPVVFEHFF
jgi:hypothetical protein